MGRFVWLLGAVCLFVHATVVGAEQGTALYSVGIAQVDITPDYPVRLSGFGFRRTESEGVTQSIWAKALAISTTIDAEPVVVITVDNLGIPASMCDEVAKRLQAKVGLSRSRLAITASHTHTAPMLRGVVPTLFGGPIPEEHLQRIDRYTADLTNHLESVALAALKDRQGSRLSWGIGSVPFAINRRTKGGPIDHDLPVLVVKQPDGKIRAIYVNYACHCVTLSNNKISGDWAGYAQDLIQREFPSSVAMVSIGCGADQNPSSGVTGDKLDIALQQGAQIAAEVKRMLTSGFLVPINGEIVSQRESITLDFAPLPTRTQWEEKAKRTDAAGYHARVQLERLDRGQALQLSLDYPIASWVFGDSLAMVFLPGEVVVDYSRRLKRELDGSRLWINAYANDEPCYIPSERVLKEGGYEASDAMHYYDRPGALKTGLEDQIVSAVRQQIESRYAAPFDANKTSGTVPLSPHQSLATLKTTSNLRVDLVVAEPLITDPVAIDFGLDGALWVAEMHDYPDGIKPDSIEGEKGESGETEKSIESAIPGGRIRLVRDTDGDGQFDRSTIFLDNIPFPTGVTVWRHGVLVCSAPDILFAADTNGDDKADVVTKLYSGFGTSNNQARLNSLCYGLDGWIYGSCGLFGGTITNFKGDRYELGDRDFRIRPDTGQIEAATGRTQQGRVRDDFGNWFGCDNTNLAYHYPIAEHYLKRNPFVGAPPSRVNVVQSDEAGKLFPARSDAQRFQLSGSPGTVTAACGIGVYRDSRLGEDYRHNLFVCEPVNLLVHRMVLRPQGTSFVAERPRNEVGTEFLRSTDGWFRPVQAVTGPDGNLWVVDMYRFIIEDPRWIPEQELAPLDVRAGSKLGRIYRISNATDQTPPATRFASKTREPVSQTPTTPSHSVFNELEIQELARREFQTEPPISQAVLDSLRQVSSNQDPTERIIRLRKLASLGRLETEDIHRAVSDGDPRVRAFGLRLAENAKDRTVFLDSVVRAASDPDPRVRLQAACSLGEWDDVRIGETLAKLALRDAEDPYIVAAVFSSLRKNNLAQMTTTLFEQLAGKEPPASLMARFLATAVGFNDESAIKLALVAVTRYEDARPQAWQINAVTDLVESLAQRGAAAAADPVLLEVIGRMQDEASVIATTESLDEAVRLAAIRSMGRDPARRVDDLERLGRLLSPAHPPAIQFASVEAFERIAGDDVPGILAAHYREVSPAVQPRMIDALLSRDAWYPLLFDEISKGTIPPSSITAAQRQELVGHPSAPVRERATQLLASAMNADRQQVVQQYRPVLETDGNAERGRELFNKNCSQCHRIGDVGHAVGPNLAMVANKTPSFLLQEILDPNRNVDTRYTSYVAVTKSGLIRTGILSSESSASITLLATEGKQFSLLRTDLDELRGTGKSLMPEGMEKDLHPQSLRDLIEFLKSVPVPAKQLAGNTPTVIKPVDGRLELPAARAAIYGDQITFEQSFHNVGFWHGVQDHVVWSVELPDTAKWDVYIDGACDAANAGNHYVLETGRQTLSGQVASTGGWNKYVCSKVGTIELGAGTSRVMLRPEGPAVRGALIDLRALYLVPAGEEFALLQARIEPDANEINDVALRILDDTQKETQRETWIANYPNHADALVVAMTKEMPKETKEEYRRIPWIWRVAVACGKRNQPDQLVKLLHVSLPQAGEPLRDWQAVVIGGGVINGIGLKGGWPKSRMAELLRDHPDLEKRWQNALTLASTMAEDERILTGTRYDALRMIALDDWKLRGEQLSKYLKKGVDDELQMGAVSGLSDVETFDVAPILLPSIGYLNDENRGLALEALLRTNERRIALLDAIAHGQIPTTQLSTSQRKSLVESNDRGVRERALRIFGE